MYTILHPEGRGMRSKHYTAYGLYTTLERVNMSINKLAQIIMTHALMQHMTYYVPFAYLTVPLSSQYILRIVTSPKSSMFKTMFHLNHTTYPKCTCCLSYTLYMYMYMLDICLTHTLLSPWYR